MKHVWSKILIFILFFSTSYCNANSEQLVIGVLNFNEVVNTFGTLTGVSKKTPKIANFLRANKASFPKDGDMKELNASFLTALSSLSSIYCSELMIKEKNLSSEERWMYKNLPLDKNLYDWSINQMRTYINLHSKTFLSRDLNSDEQKQYYDYFVGLLQNEENSDLVLNSICTSFLSTPEIYIK